MSRNWISSHDSFRKPTKHLRRQRARLQLEGLENRVVPAVSFSVNGTMVDIQGTINNDDIRIRGDGPSGDQLELSTDGGSTFNLVGIAVQDVSKLTIDGDPGNDRIDLSLLSGLGSAAGGTEAEVTPDGGNDVLFSTADGTTRYLYSGGGQGLDRFRNNNASNTTIIEARSPAPVGLWIDYGTNASLGGTDTVDIITNGGNVGVEIIGNQNPSANGGINQTWDFTNTEFRDETPGGNSPIIVDAHGGNDRVTASSVSDSFIRGGGGFNTLTAGGGTTTTTYLYNAGAASGFDTFRGNTPDNTVIAMAEINGADMGFGTNYATDSDGMFNQAKSVDIISDGGFTGVKIVGNDGGSTSRVQNWNFSTTLFEQSTSNPIIIDARTFNDRIEASDLSNNTIIGGAQDDVLRAGGTGTTTTYLYQSNFANGFDFFRDNADDNTVIVKAAVNNAQIGLAANYATNGDGSFNASRGVDLISANSFSGVTVVGNLGGSIPREQDWDFRETALEGDLTFDTGPNNDKVTTSLDRDEPVKYDGGPQTDKLTLTVTFAESNSQLFMDEFMAYLSTPSNVEFTFTSLNDLTVVNFENRMFMVADEPPMIEGEIRIEKFVKKFDPTPQMVTIDFDELDEGGNPLFDRGDVVTTQYLSEFGLTITTDNPGNHPAMIFDSSDPTGHDPDLGTPNADFGGPGIGSGGSEGTSGENRISQEKILIISEDGDSNDPDDNAGGGTLIFTWDNPVEVNRVDLLDIDGNEAGGIIELEDSTGNVTIRNMSNLSNNSFQEVAIGVEDVVEMRVVFPGSGAVSAVKWTPPDQGDDNPADDPGDPANDENNPVFFQLGDDLQFTYLVSNPVEGSQLQIHDSTLNPVDDNATPQEGSDDFMPAPVLSGGFNIGDIDQDNLVDFGETWVFIKVRGADYLGIFQNTARVTAEVLDANGNPVDQMVADEDQANYAVSGVQLNDGILEIFGTNENDFVKIKKLSGNQDDDDDGHYCGNWPISPRLKVTASFLPSSNPNQLGMEQLDLDNVDLIVIHLLDGNDTSIVNANVFKDTIQIGGTGEDKLKGGNGGNVLVGGADDDLLVGRHGRDIMIGGTGTDKAFGKSDNDILIGGTYLYEEDVTALIGLLEAWERTDLNYFERIDALQEGINGSEVVRLDATTIIDDGVADYLFGQWGLDWFLANEEDDWLDDRFWEEVTSIENDFLSE